MCTHTSRQSSIYTSQSTHSHLCQCINHAALRMSVTEIFMFIATKLTALQLSRMIATLGAIRPPEMWGTMICELYLLIRVLLLWTWPAVSGHGVCSFCCQSCQQLCFQTLLIYTIHMCRWWSFAGVRCPETAECEQRCGVYCAPDNTVTFTAAISHTKTKWNTVSLVMRVEN